MPYGLCVQVLCVPPTRPRTKTRVRELAGGCEQLCACSPVPCLGGSGALRRPFSPLLYDLDLPIILLEGFSL